MIVAVIPCYNEEQMVGDIITRLYKYVDDVIVADDGSTDRTCDISWEHGARVIKHDKRYGFGKNIMQGVETALKYTKCDIILTLDGDGQHNPDETLRVVHPIIENKADIVIGSRFLKPYKIPLYRKLGIDVITWLYNIGYKEKITDSQSCFRAYKRYVLEKLVMKDNGFGFSTEVLIRARLLNYKIVEVPISCIYHKEFKMNSSMNPIKQGVTVALATAKWRLKR